MTKHIEGKETVFFGTRNDGTRIFITKPTWDCGWCWSFGYLGNRNEHYHLNSYQERTIVAKDKDDDRIRVFTERRNMHMRDCLLADYKLNPVIEENLWVFCELARSIYSLKEAAEIFHRGGAHTTANPCKGAIQKYKRDNKLNNETLPELMQTLWDMIGGNE